MFLVDAENQILGRMSSKIAKILRGKYKTNFSPHADCGDFVIIINADKIVMTGAKMEKREIFSHTGYPGGIKSTVPSLLMKKKPEEILKLAVRRMLPGGPLAKKQLSNLKIYKGENHPHETQNPKIVDFLKLKKLRAKQSV